MADFYKKHYGQLVGKTIVKVVHDKDAEMYGFLCEGKDGKCMTVWIMCDEEGNGAGFLDILV